VPEEERAKLRDVRDLTEQAMGELLRLSHDLRPTALDDLGLPAALEAQLRRLAKDTALEVYSDISTELPPLNADQQIVLFRIAQESLSNVVQHAGASGVTLILRPEPNGGVLLRITDDGSGLPRRPDANIDRERAGLTGMRERAMLVGGNLALRSSPSGTTVELVL
jgi:two-component system sensor histidine kinase UhpB